ncbi:hypothetical protein EIP91_011722 [Steccherinum ochraceum]|uniref:Homeobox domain-containing protein n=1 Tax=Steccherinum ochraceum TaxID=92696 RepID=A0A4R0S3G2_9APHY|nr:hypothetical protein EIP91_011722 [Steccherinum ochraceum]
MSYNPDDHFQSGCWPRTTRRSPQTAANNTTGRRGFFNLPGGRTVLPPLHLPFRSSRSPAPEQDFSGTQYAQPEAFHTQADFNIHSHGQSGWAANPNLPQSHQSTTLASDPRYPTQYHSYPSRTPPSIPGDPQDPHLSSSHLYSGIPHSQQAMTPASHLRSPSTAGYPTSFASNQQQLHAAAYGYPQAPDPRNLPPPVSSMPYDTTGAPIPRRTSMSVDRTSRLSVHAPSPYARQPPQMSSTYNPEPEPMIKKKRKRADAEQLKVLNETYARTAFPSTEERIELAKKLGMSARSVQIWFQNKRQSMRQSTRQASTHAPPTTTEPFTATTTTQSTHVVAQSAGSYHASPPATMGSANMGSQGYSSQRPGESYPYGRSGPSPTPPGHRGRSHDSDPRRTPSRPY